MKRLYILIGGSGFSLGLWPPFRREKDSDAESYGVDVNFYPKDYLR